MLLVRVDPMPASVVFHGPVGAEGSEKEREEKVRAFEQDLKRTAAVDYEPELTLNIVHEEIANDILVESALILKEQENQYLDTLEKINNLDLLRNCSLEDKDCCPTYFLFGNGLIGETIIWSLFDFDSGDNDNMTLHILFLIIGICCTLLLIGFVCKKRQGRKKAISSLSQELLTDRYVLDPSFRTQLRLWSNQKKKCRRSPDLTINDFIQNRFKIKCRELTFLKKIQNKRFATAFFRNIPETLERFAYAHKMDSDDELIRISMQDDYKNFIRISMQKGELFSVGSTLLEIFTCLETKLTVEPANLVLDYATLKLDPSPENF